MITEEERAAALLRFRALLANLPAPSEDRVQRISALFSSIRLRIARDRARTVASSAEQEIPASNVAADSGVTPRDVPRVNSEHPRGKAGAGQP